MATLASIKTHFSDFLQLVYPEVCLACGRKRYTGEEVLCFFCQYRLPRTRFHNQPDNPVHQLFWGQVDVHFATAFLYFRQGGRVQRLLHQLKYRKRHEVGLRLGSLFGEEIGAMPVVREVDLLVPVPLHPARLRRRGYNQSAMIAQGLSSQLHIPWKEALRRTRHSDTQTRKQRYERWQNVQSLFQPRDKYLKPGMHVMLIDDVVTTGSTLQACAQALREAGCRVSVAAIACTTTL